MAQNTVTGFLQKEFKERKLYSPFGIALLSLVAVFIGYVISRGQLVGGSVLISLFVGIFVCIISFVNQFAGLAICFGLSFLLSLTIRLIPGLPIPIATVLDILIIITFLGILIKKIISGNNSWKFANDPVTYALAILLAFKFFELLNPNNIGLTGALLIIKRNVALFLFFITCLYCFENKKFTFNFIKVWIIFSFLLALYACKQEWIGFFSFESNFLYTDEKVLDLFFQGGRFRVFSFIDNPASLGIILSISSIFLITLLIGKFSPGLKILMGIILVFMLLAVGYSGTRTAYAMIIGGMFLFLLMNINRKETLFLGITGAIAFAVMLYGPFNNPVIARVRSTFYPEHDASFNLRDINRHRVQPYIYSNPIGGGLSTAGGNGERYNPGHRLAGFPPDSEYVNSAIETGYIGFFIFMVCNYLIMNTIINRYYMSKSPQIRIYYGALAASVFALLLANYSQQNFGLFPNDTIFYLLFALIASLYKFDINYKPKTVHHEI